MASNAIDDADHAEPQGSKSGLPLIIDDGGRARSGRTRNATDCGVRAIAIATAHDYDEVREEIHQHISYGRPGRKTNESVERALRRKTVGQILGNDWEYVPAPTLRFHRDDLPREDSMIVFVRNHFCAVVEGVIHDTFDPAEMADYIYGYFRRIRGKRS